MITVSTQLHGHCPVPENIHTPVPLVSHADTHKLNMKSFLFDKAIFLHREEKPQMRTVTYVSVIPSPPPPLSRLLDILRGFEEKFEVRLEFICMCLR